VGGESRSAQLDFELTRKQIPERNPQGQWRWRATQASESAKIPVVASREFGQASREASRGLLSELTTEFGERKRSRRWCSVQAIFESSLQPLGQARFAIQILRGVQFKSFKVLV
jgi:hypothetical protein